jgi:hypothetical protein
MFMSQATQKVIEQSDVAGGSPHTVVTVRIIAPKTSKKVIFTMLA